jgi:hypothetical protein
MIVKKNYSSEIARWWHWQFKWQLQFESRLDIYFTVADPENFGRKEFLRAKPIPIGYGRLQISQKVPKMEAVPSVEGIKSDRKLCEIKIFSGDTIPDSMNSQSPKSDTS